MIKDDESPALAGERCPWTDEEAAARISQFTSSEFSSVYGLAGLRFRNYEQLVRALQEQKWLVDLPVYIEGNAGTTWIGTIQKNAHRIRLIVQSYQIEVRIVNVLDLGKGNLP